ncbi:hypothetical protein [Lysinibacillus sp. TE18511]
MRESVMLTQRQQHGFVCAKAQCQRSGSNRVSSVRKRSANVAAATGFRLCESAVPT